MKLYSLRKVEKIESSNLFRTAMQSAARRRDSAMKGAAKRRLRIANLLALTPVNLPDCDYAEVVRRACDYYNRLNMLGKYSPDRMTSKTHTPRLNRVVVNYLRDLDEYESFQLLKTAGFGKWETVLQRTTQVLTAIAAKFPHLKTECDFQMEVELMIFAIQRKEGGCTGIRGLLERCA